MKLEDRYDKPSKHEFLVNPDKTLTHVRSGVKVACFEVTGTNTRGKRFSQMFNGDQLGFMSMQMINLFNGTRWARLTNGHRIKLNFTVN